MNFLLSTTSTETRIDKKQEVPRDRVMRLYVAVSLFVVIQVMKCPALRYELAIGSN